ncbi:5-oxoprolinase subunit PxpA [Psychrosphaera aquimarina]|uniref:5-oxoprolinase subunit PxpA n=1 Tax=Psychrosphaera aquimarina TaxID=2044854 RepID=A0ABU3R0M8_9GAMM|nr:5-oxoprolinase subunit PxpA [Psychrosphaera aquimarina]MDU0113223.1 5-oxoprolinase subunit PxpA [Psychrosphaera aquimarina]
MTKKLKLNCDLGESFGSWKMGLDDAVMPHIDMANIACGFHAGDADVMSLTLDLAKQHATQIGAHPGYLDLQGFGRRSINCSESEIINLMIYQVSALSGMASTKGLTVSYVKPHGALYNDMMKLTNIRHAIYKAMFALNSARGEGSHLSLLMLATQDNDQFILEAKEYGVELQFEVFADRRYTDDGKLQARTEQGSVLQHDEILVQVEQLCRGEVVTASGAIIQVQANTICVHGDNADGIKLISEIRRLCKAE